MIIKDTGIFTSLCNFKALILITTNSNLKNNKKNILPHPNKHTNFYIQYENQFQIEVSIHPRHDRTFKICEKRDAFKSRYLSCCLSTLKKHKCTYIHTHTNIVLERELNKNQLKCILNEKTWKK